MLIFFVVIFILSLIIIALTYFIFSFKLVFKYI